MHPVGHNAPPHVWEPGPRRVGCFEAPHIAGKARTGSVSASVFLRPAPDQCQTSRFVCTASIGSGTLLDMLPLLVLVAVAAAIACWLWMFIVYRDETGHSGLRLLWPPSWIRFGLDNEAGGRPLRGLGLSLAAMFVVVYLAS